MIVKNNKWKLETNKIMNSVRCENKNGGLLNKIKKDKTIEA